MKILFYLPFLIQFFMSAAMTHVWNVLNTMQIINTFPLYKVNTPPNVKAIQLAFKQIVNLDIIDKEAVYNYVFDIEEDNGTVLNLGDQNTTNSSNATNETYSEAGSDLELYAEAAQTNSTAEVNSTTTDAGSAASSVPVGEDASAATFKEYGMGSTKTLKSALQLIMGVVVIFALIKGFLAIEKHLIHSFPTWAQNLIKKLKGKLMYNSMLRAGIESYMVTTMGCFMAFNTKVSFETSEDTLNSLTTFMMLPYIFGFPLWVRWFLVRNRFALPDPSFKLGYNALYLNVDYFKPMGLYFQPLLLFRRCLFAMNAVFFGYSAIVQLAISLYAQQYLCQFFVSVMPMVDGPNNFVQIFNEWSILTLVIFNFNFTDYVPDPAVRYEYGWMFVYQIYFLLAVNGVIIFTIISKKIKHEFKVIDDKRRFAKKRAAYLNHNKEIDAIGSHHKKEKVKLPFKFRDPLAPIDDSVDLDKTPREEAPAPVRTINQQRKDRKQEHLELMQKLKKENEEADQKKLADINKAHEKKVSKEEKPFGPPVQDWEDAIWDDLFVDAAGNVVRPKDADKAPEEQEDFEVISSPSVRERRKL